MTIADGRSAGLGGGDAALNSHSLGELFLEKEASGCHGQSAANAALAPAQL